MICDAIPIEHSTRSPSNICPKRTALWLFYCIRRNLICDMGRFPSTASSSQGQDGKYKKKQKNKVQYRTQLSKVAQISHRALEQSRYRKNKLKLPKESKLESGKLDQDEAYDLSAYFLFEDDPDADDLMTHMTQDSIGLDTLPAEDEGRLIRFEFDPSASFGLDINSKSITAENGPIQLQVDIAESLVANSKVFREKGPDSLQLHKKSLVRTRKLKPNPHNQYLSTRYDARSIEQGLELFDTPPENDSKVYAKKKKPLHLDVEIDDCESEVSISLALAVDEGLSIEGYSLIRGIEGDYNNDQKQQNRKSKYTSMANLSRSYSNFSGKRSNSEDHHFINDTKGHMQPLVQKQSSEGSGVPEDELSVNNALAVERFISAPRLCKGTKTVPSVISFEEESENFILLARKQEDKRPESKKISMSGSKSSHLDSKRVVENRDLNRVLNHIAQLPNIDTVLADLFDEGGRSRKSFGSRKSFSSPVGVDQFNEKRPWRIPTKSIESDTEPQLDSNFEFIHQFNENEALIGELKSRVQSILSRAVPTDINVKKKSLCCPSSVNVPTPSSINPKSLEKIKSRRRIIEAAYSLDEGMGHMNSSRSVTTARSSYSVVKLKERLRQIESSMGGAEKRQQFVSIMSTS